MNSIDERIKDIITQHDAIAVHIEKFNIVSDCLNSFLFFKQYVQPAKNEEQSAVRIDSALAEIQAIIMMLGPNEWVLYITNYPLENVRDVIFQKIHEISEYANKLYPGCSGIFDVPVHKWGYADKLDLTHIIELMAPLSDADFMNQLDVKDSVLQQIQVLLKKYEKLQSYNFDALNSLEKFFIPLEKLTITKKIGQGTFSTIFHAKLKDGKTTENVAVKCFISAHCRKEHFEQFIIESSALANMSNPSIIKFFGVTSKAPFIIITEYMEGGSLFQSLQSKNGLTNYKALDAVALSIAQGLKYMHEKGIVHNDIKSLNILLTKKGVAKIGDFGSSRFVDSTNIKGPLGTIAWSAPEMLKSEGERVISTCCDVYSYGVVLLEMFTRKPPESGGPRVVPKDCPPKLRALIEQCLSFDPDARPTMADIAKMFETKQVSFEKPATASVSQSTLDYLIQTASTESFDLLGDICAEIKNHSAYVLPKLMKIEVSDIATKASLIRALRAICRTKELAEECVKLGVVDFCLNSLDQPELNSKALFLLLSVVRLSEYKFKQEEIDKLSQWPDSDLVNLCLMYGVDYSDSWVFSFTQRIVSCHEKLLSSLLCGFRVFLSKRNSNDDSEGCDLSEAALHRILGVLFNVLQAEEESRTIQALNIFIDILSSTNIELKFKLQPMILIGKWVFVQNPSIHLLALQMLILIVSKDNLVVDTNKYDFMVILLHSLPNSYAQPVLADIIFKFLDNEDIAQWFVEKQLEKTLSKESNMKMKLIFLKMMCIVANTESPALVCQNAIKVIRELIDYGDNKIIRLICRFIIMSNKTSEYIKALGSGRFIDVLEATKDGSLAYDIMHLLTVAYTQNVKIELKRSLTIAQKYIKSKDESSDAAISLIHAAFSVSKDMSLITSELREALTSKEGNAECVAFLEEIAAESL